MTLADEARIVWVDGPHVAFVRESCARTVEPDGPIPWRGPGRLVAYAELCPDAPERPGYDHECRDLWVGPGGPPPQAASGPYHGDLWPIEAVHPMTIRAGRLSNGRGDGSPSPPDRV